MTTSSDSYINGTIQPSRIPRSTTSTLHEKRVQSPTSSRNDETISPVNRKPKDLLQNRRRPLNRTLLPFPPPPTSSSRRPQDNYLILNPKDDKCERRVILIPPPNAPPVRVGRVINPTKIPAKIDNLLFDTKVLSRNHAEVFCDGHGRVFIRDLGSSNGTYINGYRLSSDAVASEPFQLMIGQELALGIDIREENQDNIAYHRVWFTIEHVGPMNPPPPDAPTPSTLGAVDLDPWIPKPSTRDIVDHLVQEINAAKQIAEEITSVQVVLDGMMEGSQEEASVMEKVQRDLEEKTRRVEELEGLLGVEREERRILEERIRVMEDERAQKLEATEKEEIVEETSIETVVTKEEPSSPITVVAIPDGAEQNTTGITTPPASPSTAPSSPLQESSTRSVSPISLPSTESSHPETTSHLLEKISTLESQLATATKEIEQLKTQNSPVLEALAATSTSMDFPFTFTAPSSPPRAPRSPRHRSNGMRNGSLRRKKPEEQETQIIPEVPVKDTGKENRELIEGLCAAVGVVVLGWMGMWLVNHLVERGERVVK